MVGPGLLLVAQDAGAFGLNGHRIVARIAEGHLTPKAAAEIRRLTGGQLLTQLATWPDEIRSDPDWGQASAWHYLSIDDDESFQDFSRNPAGDVWSALVRFEKQLRARQKKDSEGMTLKQALAFYIHFVGDIHQPLHVGRRDDYGGNAIEVTWFGEDSNLHRVWDEGLIHHHRRNLHEYVQFPDKVTARQVGIWQDSHYLTWAEESRAVRAQVYDFGEQDRGVVVPDLGDDYVFRHRNLIVERVLQAGVRLAGMLNDIFDHP